jgi:hypothetical protein
MRELGLILSPSVSDDEHWPLFMCPSTIQSTIYSNTLAARIQPIPSFTTNHQHVTHST